MTDPGRSRRRLLGLTRFLGLLAGAGLITSLPALSIQDGNAIAGILSAVIAIITLYLFVADRLRTRNPMPQEEEAAEELRIRLLEVWEHDLHRRAQRSLHTQPIPLTWTEFGKDGDPSLRGGFEGDPDEAAAQLADNFQGLPGKRRMVVLGVPGAGKTFIALALTVGLLRKWTTGGSVAVFLPLSSWNPAKDTLDDWIVGSIADSYYSGEHRTPRMLLTARRIVPVIDGLDELPEHLRRVAVDRIDETLTGDRPLVVTCRTAEYQEVLPGGSPSLLRAPAVEVQPVSAASLISRLNEIPAWRTVAQHVETRPNGYVSQALRTPLMLSFFSAAYRNRDPGELLDRNRFGSRHAVENHLVDLRLSTAYPRKAKRGGWSADQVRRWLTYLAQHMDAYKDRGTTWRKIAYSAGAGADAGPMLAALSAFILLWWFDASLLSNMTARLLKFEPTFALIVGLVAASLWLAAKREFHRRTRPHRRLELKLGAAVGPIAVLVFGTLLMLASSRLGLNSYQGVVRVTAAACALLALAVVIGLVVSLHETLIERSAAKPTPRTEQDLLRRERASTLVAAAAAGLLAGPLSLTAATIATSLGGHAGQWLASAMNLPAVLDLQLPPLPTYVVWPLTWQSLIEGSLLIGTAFTLFLAASRVWPRWLAARVQLACTGRLPWRLNRFIADATRQGLLRRAGIALEFGHVLLQDRLLAAAVNHPPVRPSIKLRVAVLGSAALLLTFVAGAAWSGKPASCGGAVRAGIDTPAVRTKIGQDTACFAYLGWDGWAAPDHDKATAQLLAKIKSQRPPAENTAPKNRNTVFVIGEFDVIGSTEWHDVLAGLAAAQQVTTGSLEVNFIFADLEGNLGPETARLIELYVSDYSSTSPVLRNDYGGFAAIGLDLEWSRPLYDGNRGSEVVGLKDPNMHRQAEEHGKRAVTNWLAHSMKGSVPPDCEAVKQAGEVSRVIDFRGGGVTPSTLNDLSACGGAEIMVDQATAIELAQLPRRPAEVKISYLEDKSATIAQDCARAMGNATNAEPMNLSVCVAAVSVNESFRVYVEELP